MRRQIGEFTVGLLRRGIGGEVSKAQTEVANCRRASERVSPFVMDDVARGIATMYSLGRQLVPKVLLYVSPKFPLLACFCSVSSATCGTPRKHFTKPPKQVAAPDCTYFP